MARYALCAALFLTAAAFAAPPSVVVRLEPPITPIYEPALLVLEVEVDRDAAAIWPGVDEHLRENIGVFGEPDLRTQNLPDNRVRITTTYTLDPLHEDDYPIGPLRLAWGDNGDSITLPGPVLTVREPTAEELEALARMEANAMTPMPPQRLGWQAYLLGLGAAALLGLLIGWWWRTRDKEDFYTPSTLTPWERATEALRALRDRKLAERGEHEPYYIELSGILRSYIEGRFHLHAPEMTTEEFLHSASDSGLLTAEQQGFLARFLKQSDRVKFAKLVPPAEDMKASWTQVMDFVEETIPREQENEAEAPEAAA